MKLVSENSEDDLKKRAATEDFERALTTVAINMLRVIAGAGEPYHLLRNIHECALATQAYRDAHKEHPSAVRVAQLLDYSRNDADEWSSWSKEERERWGADGTYDKMLAAAHIRQASLRVVAGQWAGNRTVLTNAERLFCDAVRQYEEVRERKRSAYLKPSRRNK